MTTVLLVEDSPSLRKVTQQLLETLPGVTVVSASSAEEARASVKAHQPACAIVDQNLRNGSSVSLVRELRTVLPSGRVIITSGSPPGATAGRPDEGGSVPVLNKPYAPERLLALVRAALPSASSASQPAPQRAPTTRAGAPDPRGSGAACALRMSAKERHDVLNRLSRMLVCTRALQAELRHTTTPAVLDLLERYADVMARTIDEIARMLARPTPSLTEPPCP